MVRALVVAPVLAIGASSAVAAGGGGSSSGKPPAAPVRDCGDRISGAVVVVNGKSRPYRFVVRKDDTVVGPLAFSGAKAYGRRQAAWDDMVRRDQWLKSVATLRSRARVTVEVPREQREWMRLEYVHGAGGQPVYAVTLKACRHRERTAWSGGFTIDYVKAPKQGRCAEILVWVTGRDRPLRKRLFGAPARFCRS